MEKMIELIGLIPGRPRNEVQSADEFYRRLFGTDNDRSGHPSRSGFTIVFVNDGSERCRRFLANHLADIHLCGSSELPIVFFSRLDLAEGARVLQAVRTEHSDRAFLIPLVCLERLPRQEWPRGEDTGDFVRWSVNADEVMNADGQHLRQIPFHQSRRMVVFGTEESGWFARRFGVSADAPCFVILTESKGLSCQMLPFLPEDSRGDGVSRKLKEWISTFRHANREAFLRCEAIEDAIEETLRNAEWSRGFGKNCLKNFEREWERVGGLAGLEDVFTRMVLGDISQLEWICRSLRADPNLHGGISTAAQRALDVLPRLKVSGMLRSSTNLAGVRAALRAVPESLRVRWLVGVPLRLSERVRDRRATERFALGLDVTAHIRHWWWQAVNLTLFDRAFRLACGRRGKPVPQKLAADPMEGLRMANHALSGQKLGTAPSAMADCAIHALSRWSGEDLTLEKWVPFAEEIRNHIIKRWSQVLALTNGVWFGTELADLPAEVIFPMDMRSAIDRERKPSHPALAELNDRLSASFAERKPYIKQALESDSLQLRDELLRTLWGGDASNDNERIQQIQRDLLTACKGAASDAESRIAGLRTKINAKHPSANDTREELQKLLAEHSGILDNLVLPFQNHPGFRRIHLDLKKLKREVCGDLQPYAGSAARLFRRVQDAELLLKEEETVWRKVVEETHTFGSIPHLAQKLITIFPGERIEELLPEGMAGTLENRIEGVLTRQQWNVLLERMHPDELLGLAKSLVRPDFEALLTLAEPVEIARSVFSRLGALA